jgi:hypothetical protein
VEKMTITYPSVRLAPKTRYLTLQVWSCVEPNKVAIIKTIEIRGRSEKIHYPKKWRGFNIYDLEGIAGFAREFGFKIDCVHDVDWRYIGHWKK